ncbi:Fe(3+)-hydroxamate ABC transporter permease FhuB [Pseudochelatococcus sp. B33]
MSEALTVTPHKGIQRGILVAMFVLAALLTVHDIAGRLAGVPLYEFILRPDLEDIRQALVFYVSLPRITVAFLAGAILALAGIIMQQVLRNPLAEPATLGIGSGAYLALAVATLWAPALVAAGRVWVAIGGSVVAAVLVFGLAWPSRLSPLSIILAGLVTALYLGVLGSAVVLFNHDHLLGLFIWGTGFLGQTDWGVAVRLAPLMVVAAMAAVLMQRSLAILDIGDEGATNLGLSLTKTRFLALAMATVLAAVVVAEVGMIGFIGLAAPAIARLSGARRVRDRLLWAPLLGGLLLWLTDELVLLIPAGFREVPTGAATALLGAPLLLWLLPHLRSAGPSSVRPADTFRRCAHAGRYMLGLGLLLVMAVAGSLFVSRGFFGANEFALGFVEALEWRGPRILAAIAVGVLLALAGVLMQRMTGNPMAAPEILGVSSGAALGIVGLLLFAAEPTRGAQLIAGVAGATAILCLLMSLGRRNGFSPDRLLICGIAIGAVFGIIVSVALATGHPRMGFLLSWLAGSTYAVRWPDAIAAAVLASVLGLASITIWRWLDIWPLGAAASLGLGVNVTRSRALILLMVATMTAAATLVIGPLSFIGLMSPHIAYRLGLHRPVQQLAGAALIGALLLVLSDWIGRTVIFPFQLPTGLVAVLIGGPYLMWLIVRRR